MSLERLHLVMGKDKSGIEMKSVCFLKEETFIMSQKCHFCDETKRVGFVVSLEGGKAFSVCHECGEEAIRRLRLRMVSPSIWASSKVL